VRPPRGGHALQPTDRRLARHARPSMRPRDHPFRLRGRHEPERLAVKPAEPPSARSTSSRGRTVSGIRVTARCGPCRPNTRTRAGKCRMSVEIAPVRIKVGGQRALERAVRADQAFSAGSHPVVPRHHRPRHRGGEGVGHSHRHELQQRQDIDLQTELDTEVRVHQCLRLDLHGGQRRRTCIGPRHPYDRLPAAGLLARDECWVPGACY